MAEPINFPERNATLKGYGEVEHLPTWTDGKESRSCWQLSPEEVVEIARTKTVWLCVLGRHPAMKILGVSPFPVATWVRFYANNFEPREEVVLSGGALYVLIHGRSREHNLNLLHEIFPGCKVDFAETRTADWLPSPHLQAKVLTR